MSALTLDCLAEDKPGETVAAASCRGRRGLHHRHGRIDRMATRRLSDDCSRVNDQWFTWRSIHPFIQLTSIKERAALLMQV